MVTILILIDGFLQFTKYNHFKKLTVGHNPYFNRWFSAILFEIVVFKQRTSHNPYFNRWFSAINNINLFKKALTRSQSLF